MIDFIRLEKIETEWEDIQKECNFYEYNTPINREEERRKTLKLYKSGVSYNPKFIYRKPPNYPIKKILTFMNKLKPKDFYIEKFYYEKAQNFMLDIYSIITHEPRIISAATCLSYGLPNNDLLNKAFKILPKSFIDYSNDIKNFTNKDISEPIKNILSQVGFNDWDVVITAPMNAPMFVQEFDKKIYIRKDIYISLQTLKRAIIHELGVHVLRYENGIKQSIRLFRSGFPMYLETEEGLAVYCEEKYKVLGNETLQEYAGRYIAANLALTQPFSEVFKFISTKLGPKKAFDIVTRSKRGFINTEQPGAHTKDIIYFGGYLSMKKYLDKNSNDYKLFFIGQIGIQQIPIIKTMLNDGIISMPNLLPDDFNKLINTYLEDKK